jgi:hypothetical protein
VEEVPGATPVPLPSVPVEEEVGEEGTTAPTTGEGTADLTVGEEVGVEEGSPAVELTDRDNDPDDMTVDSTDGPLKIQFELEQDPGWGPNFYDIRDYTFEFRGLKQGSYILQEGQGRILADRSSVSLLGIGNLEVKNGTETDVMQITGHVMVDKIQEDATQTTYSLERDGLVTIGDLEWYDVTGNLTTTTDGNKGTLVLVDRP